MSMDKFPVDRRRFITLGVGAFAATALPIGLIRRRQVVRRQVPVMGTIADLVAVHRNEEAGYEALDAAVSELRWVESRMTRFDGRSDVGRANLGAFNTAVPIHPATAMVLSEGLRWAERTGGRFDPALGRVTGLWDVGNRTSPPSDEELASVTQSSPYQSVDIASSGSSPTIRFGSNIAIDLGGIAKGYAVDRAADALRRHRVTSGMINVGGDLYAIGSSPDGDPWQVGIRNPFNPDEVLESVPVNDGAIATSGDYLRFFEHRGNSYHHLLNAATGKPLQSGMRSITVAAETCMAADAGATATFGMEPPEARAVLGRQSPGAVLINVV